MEQAPQVLPEQILKNINTIISLQAQQERQIPIHYHVLEKIASAFGQPWFLYAEIVFFLAWGTGSHLATIGLLSADFPRFDLRDQGIDVASLLISTGVLIHQTRQEKLSDERSHLILQLNLLTDQKIAKLIALVEELRVDLPNVRDRYDFEAEMMQQATDPQVVLDILQETLKQGIDLDADLHKSKEEIEERLEEKKVVKEVMSEVVSEVISQLDT
jgi:uncharacterized membrane protein